MSESHLRNGKRAKPTFNDGKIPIFLSERKMMVVGWKWLQYMARRGAILQKRTSQDK